MNRVCSSGRIRVDRVLPISFLSALIILISVHQRLVPIRLRYTLPASACTTAA